MTRDEVVRFLQQRQKHWAARDADGLASQHALHGTVNSPMFGKLSGREAIAHSYQRLFEAFPDWSLNQEDEVLIDGDRVAEPFSVSATHAGEFMGLPGTKHRTHIQGVLLMRLADGFIEDERRLYDFSMLLMQVGVLKSKPGY
jgi:predicted ester cyclase